jgi:CRP/FNR family transcriptional regulator, nitrogen oxide reductase regulator
MIGINRAAPGGALSHFSNQCQGRLRMAEAKDTSLLVKRSELFAGLPSSVYASILSGARPRDFKFRDVMYFAGDPIKQILMLTEGRVKITQLSEGGTEVILRLSIPGDLISELALVPGGSHSSTAQALQDCTVLAWDSATFEAALERFPDFRNNAKRILERRLKEFERRYCEVSTETVSPRLAHSLLRLMEQIGHKVNSHIEINVSQEALAQMTAMTSFTVCRLLTNWEAQGLVKLRRETIEIHSVPRLAGLSKYK